MNSCHHDSVPHIYFVYWPQHRVFKVGISHRNRWRAFIGRGGVEIAAMDTCCMSHARNIERHMHSILDQETAKAFTEKRQARPMLGPSCAGWTECYAIPEAPSEFGEHNFQLPASVIAAMDHFSPRLVWKVEVRRDDHGTHQPEESR